MNKKQLGNELHTFLKKEKNITKISRWAFRLYADNVGKFDSICADTLEYIFSMDDDPQFEYTIDELNILADKLMNGEENPIKKINEIKMSKG